ncbi:mannose-1-phosphate guanylyltransferase/mannose-6-phosphate isomerase, partial [Escherichia coli 97.0010]
MKPQNC